MPLDHNVLVTLLVALALIAIDWLMGVLVAIHAGTFSIQLLPHQLATMVLPYMGSLSVLAVVQQIGQAEAGKPVSEVVTGVFYAAAVAFLPKVAADIVAKARATVGA